MQLSAKGQAATLRVRSVFANMRKTSAVMFDRGMWCSPIYDTLAADGFRSLCRTSPNLTGQEASAEEPVRYALGYAQLVLVGTAIELTLLHSYINSLAIYQLVGGDMQRLSALRKWVESGRRRTTFDRFLHLPPDEQTRRLKEISFSDLPKAQEMFADIYGIDCFAKVWTPEGYRDLRITLQDVQTRRNGVVHRGGELKDGKMIEISAPALREAFDQARQISERLRSLSHWFLEWWMKEITRRFSG
jgi:hypothetical protein